MTKIALTSMPLHVQRKKICFAICKNILSNIMHAEVYLHTDNHVDSNIALYLHTEEQQFTLTNNNINYLFTVPTFKHLNYWLSSKPKYLKLHVHCIKVENKISSFSKPQANGVHAKRKYCFMT